MWGVVFKGANGYRQIKRFTTEEEANEFAAKAVSLTKKFPSLKIVVVSLLKAFPPDETKKKPKGTYIYWCPYCREYRRFRMGNGGYRRCELCGISDMDFYVKKYNHSFK